MKTIYVSTDKNTGQEELAIKLVVEHFVSLDDIAYVIGMEADKAKPLITRKNIEKEVRSYLKAGIIQEVDRINPWDEIKFGKPFQSDEHTIDEEKRELCYNTARRLFSELVPTTKS